MDYLIRPASEDDLAGIAELQNHYILNTHCTFEVAAWSAERQQAWFRGHNDGKRYRTWVAVGRDGCVCGYSSSGSFRERAAYETTVETSVYLRPDAVGQGLGSRLYEALFASLQGQDLRRIVAGIAMPNEASVALHRKFGFTAVGTYHEVGRKFGRYIDVLWLERPFHLG